MSGLNLFTLNGIAAEPNDDPRMVMLSHIANVPGSAVLIGGYYVRDRADTVVEVMANRGWHNYTPSLVGLSNGTFFAAGEND